MSLQEFVQTDRLVPHGVTYGDESGLLWTQVISDGLTGISYWAISFVLLWLVLRARKIEAEDTQYAEGLPFSWMFLAFGLFIVACGTTHLFHIWTIWRPDYWMDAGIKVLTAAASVATAIALPPLVPRVLRMIDDARRSRERQAELREAHDELKEAHARIQELDELKSNMFANVSHELRTPLTLILGQAERMRGVADSDPNARRRLGVIRRNAEILWGHVEDLLDVSRVEAGVLEPRVARFDLATRVRRLTAQFDTAAADRGIGMELDIPESLVVESDPGHLDRIATNLLSNAVKFTPEEGRIVCRVAGSLPGTAEEIEDERDEEEAVVLEVRDSGPGISEDLREQIFDRFRQVDSSSTRRHQGTGLGLAIARELARALGGTVSVDDAPEGGARFRAVVPRTQAAPVEEDLVERDGDAGADMEAALAPPPPDRRGPTDGERPGGNSDGHRPGARTPLEERARRGVSVLVVEDNPDMRAFLADQLRDVYRVREAENGKAALASLEEEPADLILTDVMMPEMGGDELVREVRRHRRWQDIPIVVLTARASEDLRVDLLRAGAQDYLAKPFSGEEILARVGNLLECYRARRILRTELETTSEDLEDLAERLTSRKRELDHALARAEEASRAKSGFLGVISHELRTPINAIVGYTDLLQHEIAGPLTEDQRSHLNRIQRSGEHLRGLVDQVLTFTRLEAGQEEPDLKEVYAVKVASAAIEMVNVEARGKDMDIRLDAQIEEGERILTDPTRARQILNNLLENAVKFGSEGDNVEVRVQREGDRVRFAVLDEGQRISPDLREQIFEPFVQADQSYTRITGGAGLGLAVARRCAELLGGDLRLEGRSTGGNIFTLVLPAHGPE